MVLDELSWGSNPEKKKLMPNHTSVPEFCNSWSGPISNQRQVIMIKKNIDRCSLDGLPISQNLDQTEWQK